MLPGDVQLEPAQPVPGAGGIGVVVVMPTLAKTEDRHPPTVAGEVGAVEVAVAPGVGGRVHQPGDVIHDHQAQGDGPQHQPQATAMHPSPLAIDIQTSAQGPLQQQEPAIQPAIKGIALQVAGEPRHVGQRWDLVQHPGTVGPPQAAGGVVVIVGLIGKAVVVAVQPHPLDRTALAGQGPHQHKEPLQPPGRHKAAMGQHAMQPQGDAEHGDPVKNRQGHQGLPAPKTRQKGEYGTHVHDQHEAGGAELVSALLRGQGLSPQGYRLTHADLLPGAGAIGNKGV